jgi:hypothetical protein
MLLNEKLEVGIRLLQLLLKLLRAQQTRWKHLNTNMNQSGQVT